MDMYTHLNKDYGIESITDCQLLHSVSRNKIYVIQNKYKKFLVRILEKSNHDLEQLMFSCKIMYMIHKDLSITPYIYVSSDKKYISHIGDNYMIVMEYIENDTFKDHLDLRNISSSLSLMLTFLNYTIKQKDVMLKLLPNHKHKFQTTRRVFNNVDALLNRNEVNFINKSRLSNYMIGFIDFYSNYLNILSEESCVIHGDIHRDNFLYKGNKATHIIDFDRSTIDTFYIDLASYIIWTCFMDENSNYHNVNQPLYSFIIKRYEQKIITSINLKYLSYYIVLLLLKPVYFLNKELIGIIDNYIECCT